MNITSECCSSFCRPYNIIFKYVILMTQMTYRVNETAEKTPRIQPRGVLTFHVFGLAHSKP